MRSAAFAGAPHAVRVNLVAAGLVDTPMASRALGDPRIRARLPELISGVSARDLDVTALRRALVAAGALL